MRIALVTGLALMLSGCAVPEVETSPLLGVCPQWEAADWSDTGMIDLDQASPGAVHLFEPEANGTDLEHPQGFALDRYRIHFTAFEADGATLELRAYANETSQRGIYDYRDPDRPLSVPFLALGPDSDVVGKEFDIFLTPVAHGSPPAPSGLGLGWAISAWNGTGSASASFDVLAAYRVCGAVLP